MTTSFGAMCTDFYINQSVSLKMDLPTGRETVLDMFDRVRREIPSMDRFRRFEEELSLESPEHDSQYSWLSLRRTAVRSGWVNPEALGQAYRLHRLVLETAPYFLSISPIDVEYVELVFGFDFEARTNRNEVVFDAMLNDSPLASLVHAENEPVLDAEPFIGFALTPGCEQQAFVEIKTRTLPREVAANRYENEPISVYLTVRRYGTFGSIDELPGVLETLTEHVERLAEERVVPHVVVPIREALMSRPS